MKDIFSIICRRCRGKCCRFKIFLTKKERKKLKEADKRFRAIKQGSGFLLAHKDWCPFLRRKDGCKLEKELKPLDCLMFPITFTYQKGKLKFYLVKDCPYFNKIPKRWIKKHKRWSQRQLRGWSIRDKKSYSQMIIDADEPLDLIPI